MCLTLPCICLSSDLHRGGIHVHHEVHTGGATNPGEDHGDGEVLLPERPYQESHQVYWLVIGDLLVMSVVLLVY